MKQPPLFHWKRGSEMKKIHGLLIGLLVTLPACTQVDISTGGTDQKVCVGNDTLDCADTSTSTDNSNDGDDSNTTTNP